MRDETSPLPLHLQVPLSQWNFPTAVAHFGVGVASAHSTEGLHRLRALAPNSWHELVYNWTAELRPGRRISLKALLSSRFASKAMPRHAHDYERVCRYRRAARRLVERFGRRGLAWFTEERLEAYRQELVDEGLSASTAARTVSYLRVTLREWCNRERVRPKVSRVPPSGPSSRLGDRAVRRFASPFVIARLLPQLTSEQRAMVALAAGGLLQSEFLALRREDIWAEARAVHVRTGGIRGRPGVACDRVEYLPSWAWELIARSLPSLGTRGGLLFPPRGGGDQPRASAARGLRRVCDRVLGEGGGITFSQIRDLGREVLRRAGAPRLAVRQTWTRADFGRRGPPWLPEVKAVMGSWTDLCAPPASLAGSGRVPRRAPPGCRPTDSEIGAANQGRRPQTLPASCRPLSPSEVEASTESAMAEVTAVKARLVPRRAQRPRGGPTKGRARPSRANRSALRRDPAPVAAEDSRALVRPRSTGSSSPVPESQEPAAPSAGPPNQLSASDKQEIADLVVRALATRERAERARQGGGPVTMAQLRREIVGAMRRRGDERLEDFLAGAAVGAGGTWAANNQEKVAELLGELGVGLEGTEPGLTGMSILP